MILSLEELVSLFPESWNPQQASGALNDTLHFGIESVAAFQTT